VQPQLIVIISLFFQAAHCHWKRKEKTPMAVHHHKEAAAAKDDFEFFTLSQACSPS